MKLYCMCHERNDKPESQAFMAPNLYGLYDTETEFRTVILQKAMAVIKNGVKQFLLFPSLHGKKKMIGLKKHG